MSYKGTAGVRLDASDSNDNPVFEPPSPGATGPDAASVAVSLEPSAPDHAIDLAAREGDIRSYALHGGSQPAPATFGPRAEPPAPDTAAAGPIVAEDASFVDAQLSSREGAAVSATVGDSFFDPAYLDLDLVPGGTDPTSAVARRDAFNRRALALADALAALTAYFVTMVVTGHRHWPLAILAAAPVIVVMSKVTGLYNRDESVVSKSTLEEAPALFQLASIYALVVWLIACFAFRIVNNRWALLVDWVGVVFLLLLFRTAARWCSRQKTSPERCLVIGDQVTTDRLRRKLGRNHTAHARVVSYVPLAALDVAGRNTSLPLSRDDLQRLTAELGVDRIIVAPQHTDGDDVLDLTRWATELGIKVSLVPRVLEVVGSSVEFDHVEGIPLLSMRQVQLGRSSQLVKRAVDLTLSVVGLGITLPLFALIAVLIKLDSRGPVFFRQVRVGREGKHFLIVKFRTMAVGADAQREQLRHLNESDGLFKIARDPRITRVGFLLRRLSLDELPQLWNVMRGDMSLVGPRPLVLEEDGRIQGWHRRRLGLTPGMTGQWQILGSSRVPLDEMVKIDYLYVTSWSLWTDVKILLRTVPYMLKRRGM